MNLIANALRTPDGTVLESKSRHDYKEYVDANGKTYMIDGGLDYHRRSANGDEENMCMYDDVPHETQVQVLTWGTYGINGDQPLQYKTIAEMDTSHIEAVLQTVKHIRPMIKTVMQNELKFRQQHVTYE